MFVCQRRVAKGVYSLDIPQLDTISDPAKERLILILIQSRLLYFSLPCLFHINANFFPELQDQVIGRILQNQIFDCPMQGVSYKDMSSILAGQ
jgi:hypothetical protein